MIKAAIYLLMFSLMLPLMGKSISPVFETVSPETGFTFGAIKTIAEDKNGFIWFSSDHELYYYNSQQIIKYNLIPEQPNNATTLTINKIYKDKQQNLWVCTKNGLFQFNETNNSFNTVEFNSAKPIGSQTNVSDLIQWDTERYLLTINNKLYIFHTYNHSLVQLHSLNPDFPERISFMDKTENGELIIATNNGVILTGTSLESKPKTLYQSKYNFVTSVCYSNGLYYIGFYEDGIEVINSAGIKIKDYNTRNSLYNHLPNNKIKQIIARDNDEIWVATHDGILVIKDNKSEIIKANAQNQLPNNMIFSLFKDRKNNIWVGTWNGGLGLYSDFNYRFLQFKKISTSRDFKSSVISSFTQDYLGNIWIASENHGISVFDENSFSLTEKYNPNNYPLLFNTKSLASSNGKKIWMGLFNNGLYTSDVNTQQLQKWNNPNFSPGIIISSITTSKSKVWLGTRRSGLYELDLITRQWKNYDLSKINPAFKEANWIWKTYLDSRGDLWICSEYGLYQKPSNSEKINHYFTSEASTSLPQNYNYTICEDGEGNLWIGSQGGGISIYQAKTKQFIPFTNNYLIANMDVYGIVLDAAGDIWFSTNQGIYSHNLANNKTKHYAEIDGLLGNQYLPNSAFVSSTGKLYFGTSNGFNIIDPTIINTNPIAPEVYITNMLINNNPIDHYQIHSLHPVHIANIDTLTLNHWQNSLTFSFATNNFIKPANNKFKYRLLNYQEEWTEASSKTEITFTKIPPGNYTLEVLGSNNDLIWSEHPRQIQIKIIAPIWLRWYAYLAYILVTIVITLAIARELIFRYKLQKQIISERYKSEANDMLYREKQKFFMNISHEFRTPLTLVLSPITSLINKFKSDTETTDHLKIIKRNADRLLRLTNQILDFNLIEAGKKNIKFEKTDIVNLCTLVCQYFEFQLTQKQLDLQFNTQYKSFKIEVDEDMIEKIIYNLISNAIKFSNENGQLIVSIDKQNISKETYLNTMVTGNEFIGEALTIKIQDFGQGINPTLLPTIFERFTTDSNQAHTGYGIGLHISMEYTRLNHANLMVSSELNKGTIFTLNIPTHLAFESELETTLSQSKIQAKEEVEPASPVTNAIPSSIKKVVLLAEDNEELRNYIKGYIGTKYKVLTAKNGSQALEIANEILPDLIITDISMPGMDGLELTKQLKDQDQTKHIPIIVLTALPASTHQMSSMIQGADTFLTKPIDESTLLAQIENIFQNRERLKEKHPGLDTNVTNIQDIFKGETFEIAEHVIEQNLHNAQFGVDQLAKELKMSRATLHRKIKTHSNQNTSEFIREIRLKNALKLLKAGNYNVDEIAEYVGFNSTSYFSRTFKAKYGSTPTDYFRNRDEKTS